MVPRDMNQILKRVMEEPAEHDAKKLWEKRFGRQRRVQLNDDVASPYWREYLKVRYQRYKTCLVTAGHSGETLADHVNSQVRFLRSAPTMEVK